MPTIQLRTYRVIILLCLCAMSFTSCIINSTLTDIPLIEEKNQFVASAGFSFIIPTRILTASYGLTNHIALQSKYAKDSKYTTLQQSLGYYWKLPERKNIEVYAGYAQGGGSESYDSTEYYFFLMVIMERINYYLRNLILDILFLVDMQQLVLV